MKDAMLEPAAECFSCQQTLDEVGGFRIVAQQLRGVWVSADSQEKCRPGAKVVTIDHEGTAYRVEIWGDEWSREAITRAKAAVRDGNMPWYCERCARYVCSSCQHIFAFVPGAEVLRDSGGTAHVGILPIGRPCSNESCDRYLGKLPDDFRVPTK